MKEIGGLYMNMRPLVELSKNDRRTKKNIRIFRGNVGTRCIKLFRFLEYLYPRLFWPWILGCTPENDPIGTSNGFMN
jgi:hypothetical protein